MAAKYGRYFLFMAVSIFISFGASHLSVLLSILPYFRKIVNRVYAFSRPKTHFCVFSQNFLRRAHRVLGQGSVFLKPIGVLEQGIVVRAVYLHIPAV